MFSHKNVLIQTISNSKIFIFFELHHMTFLQPCPVIKKPKMSDVVFFLIDMLISSFDFDC